MTTQNEPKITKDNILLRWYQGFLENVDSSAADKRLKELRKEGLERVFKNGVGYLKMGFFFPLVGTVTLKKGNMIMTANTKQEIEAIEKFSCSETDSYYVPEEELLMLCVAQRQGQLTTSAQKRFLTLYENCLKEKVHG